VKKSSAWIWAAICALSIFVSVPFALSIQKAVARSFGRAAFIYLVLAVVAAFSSSILYVLAFRLKIKKPSRFVWIIVCAGLYVYFVLQKIAIPVEAVHFLEYGLLAYFLYRAWRLSIPDVSVYVTAFLTGALIGMIDEIIQWVTPDRYWDIRDVGLNALSVGLFLLALGTGIRPEPTPARVDRKSVRFASITFAANLILLGTCLSNTPARFAALVQRFPFLAPLQKQEPMGKDVFRHKDPELGTFYSRLTLAWLAKTDLEQRAESARVLDEWKDKSLALFLAEYPASTCPFLHEMRVHLSRRDKKFAAGDLFVSWKENRILEKYFGETLAASAFRWNDERRAGAEAGVDKNAPYESPVCKFAFDWLGGGKMWTAICAILALLGASSLLRPRFRTLGDRRQPR